MELCCVFVFIPLALICLYVFRQSRKHNPERICKVYSQPGKWYVIKYYSFLLLLILRRAKYYLFGKRIFHDEKEMEKLKPLSDHPLGFDAVFFHAVSQDGVYFCGGNERRHQSITNGLVYLMLPEYGLLSSEKLPKTVLKTDPGVLLSLKEYSAEGITFTPVEPMKTWRVAYKGKMRLHRKPEELVDVDLQCKFTSNFPWFLYDVEIPIKNIARAVAREPWNEERFRCLKEAHQTHYEQMGYMDGSVKINNKEIPLKLDAFRDHSFGYKRDWNLMHRYIFQMFYLSNGTKISLGVVSQPCTTSQILMGYICHPNGRINAIDECDINLYEHGEDGTPPDDLCFTFNADDTQYEVQVKYELTVVHYVGENKLAKMHERFLTCDVNCISGRGISEWHYNGNTYGDAR